MSTALLLALSSDASVDGYNDSSKPRTPSPTALRDAAWVVRIRAGDEAAFEALFRVYVHPLFRFAASYTYDDAIAHEIVDDVFVAVWHRRSVWEPSEGAAAYLFAAVRHRALNAIRDERRRERRTDRAADHVRVENDAHQQNLVVVHETSDDEDARLVDQLLAALPEQRRRVMVLRWRYELSPDEIAAALGMSRNAVYLALSRSLETLRRLFGTPISNDSSRG